MASFLKATQVRRARIELTGQRDKDSCDSWEGVLEKSLELMSENRCIDNVSFITSPECKVIDDSFRGRRIIGCVKKTEELKEIAKTCKKLGFHVKQNPITKAVVVTLPKY